jgi:predicted dehydrogenase
MTAVNRRTFLKDSALLASLAAAGLTREQAAAAEAARTAAARKGPAGDRLRVAVVGVRARGQAHVAGLAGRHNCVVTVICDADQAVIGPAMRQAEKAQGSRPRFEQDLRKVVEDHDVDVVTVATPNHWHALAAVWAIQNGKDVYVEKPVSHNVSEGRRIVEAARKYGRICQTGTQSRSAKGMRDAIAFLRSGKLGKVKLARGLCYKLRPSIGKVSGPQPVPKSVDYDLWCGPAPAKPLMRRNLHYDWHWVWDTGNGDLGNQGIHEMDKARWGLGKAQLPNSVLSVGGRFGYVDDGETANTQICVYDYGDCELIFEVRGWPSKSPFPGKEDPKGGRLPTNFVGNVWYGSEGFLVCPSYERGVAYSNDGEVIARFAGGEDHFANFVQAVRSRRAEDLNADILEGHLSSALCHLGNVSYRLGTLQPFRKKANAFGDDKEAGATFARMEEHLQDNGIALDGLDYHLGRKLRIDPKTESFVGDQQADQMLTRDYRKGFSFA